MIIKCPHCDAEDSLASEDQIRARSGIQDWRLEGGKLIPEYDGEADVDWDSQAPIYPEKPYVCLECETGLSEADLLATLPKRKPRKKT